jgi:hypothetical protein
MEKTPETAQLISTTKNIPKSGFVAQGSDIE